MSLPFIIVAYIAVSTVAQVFTKLCSNSVVGGVRAKYTLFFAVNSFASCLIFGIFSGFKISINLPTLLFSALYALVVFLVLIGSLFVFKYAAISTVNIVTNAAVMLLTPIFGIIIFSDTIDLTGIIKIVIMLVAVVFVFLDSRKKESSSQKGGVKRAAIVCLLFFLTLRIIGSVANSVVMKLYSNSATVSDENSFFFMTNLLLGSGALIVLIIDLLRGASSPKETLRILTLKNVSVWTFNVLLSNIGSVLSIWMIAKMDVAIYTPTTAAIGIIAALVASISFREKLGVFSYVAATIACVAMIL